MNKKKIKRSVSVVVDEKMYWQEIKPVYNLNNLKSKIQKLEQENSALRETIEIMSDKKIMQRISNGSSGPSKPLREVLKKYGYN